MLEEQPAAAPRRRLVRPAIAVPVALLPSVVAASSTPNEARNSYGHNDAAGAYPNYEFFDRMVPFLAGIG